MQALHNICNDFCCDFIANLSMIGAQEQVACIFQKRTITNLIDNPDSAQPVTPTQEINARTLAMAFWFQCLDDNSNLALHRPVYETAVSIGNQPNMRKSPQINQID